MVHSDPFQNYIEELAKLANTDEVEVYLAQSDLVPYRESIAVRLTELAEDSLFSNPLNSLKYTEFAIQAATGSRLENLQGAVLLKRGHARRFLGQHIEALADYRQATLFFKRTGNTLDEGRTYLGELASLSELGQFSNCLKRAEWVRRRLRKLQDKRNLAMLDVTVASVYYFLGRYDSSLRIYNRALRSFQELGLEDWVINTRVNRAGSLELLNRLSEAAQDYEVGKEYYQQHDLPVLSTITDLNLATLQFRQARYNEAIERLSNTRESFSGLGQPDKRAQAELTLGNCYAALGLFEEANEIYQISLGTLTELEMKYEAIWAQIGLSQVLINQGKLQEAETRLGQVLATYEQAAEVEQNLHAISIARFYYAQALFRLGENNTAEALRLCREAGEAFATLKLNDWYVSAMTLEGDILRQEHDLAAAEKIYLTTLELAQPLKLPHLLYQLHYGLGKIYQNRAEGISDQINKANLITAARQEYLKATAQVETIRAVLRPEELRVAFMENGLAAIEALVALCLQDADNPDRLQEAFTYIEQSKSRSLLDLLTADLLNPPSGQTGDNAHPGLLSRIEELRNELNWLYSRIHNPSIGLDEENQRFVAIEQETVNQQAGKLEKELAQLLRRYRAGILPEYSLPEGLPGRVQSHQLKAGQVVLEYYLLGNEVTAFVIAPDKLEYYPGLCQIEEVISLKEHLDFQANKFNLGTNYIERRLPQLTEAFNHYLSKFYHLLLAPIIATLSAQELMIIPHGKLHSLPFHAFFDGESYLIEKFQVSYAPSFRVLLHCLEQKDRKPEKLLAVAVPDEKLSGVEVEVRSIAKLFPCAKVLVGEEATRKNLEEHLAWSDIVHLASHGHFRTDNPLFSMLKLYNEWLSVHDVMGLRFRPTLVTLSACQTGLAHPLRGDELLGLARGFMAAGAYSLVVSLWSVNDEVTTELMQRFYQNLVAGRGRAASLRQAMLQLCKESRYAHPYYWAPFIVIGQP